MTNVLPVLMIMHGLVYERNNVGGQRTPYNGWETIRSQSFGDRQFTNTLKQVKACSAGRGEISRSLSKKRGSKYHNLDQFQAWGQWISFHIV